MSQADLANGRPCRSCGRGREAEARAESLRTEVVDLRSLAAAQTTKLRIFLDAAKAMGRDFDAREAGLAEALRAVQKGLHKECTTPPSLCRGLCAQARQALADHDAAKEPPCDP